MIYSKSVSAISLNTLNKFLSRLYTLIFLLTTEVLRIILLTVMTVIEPSYECYGDLKQVKGCVLRIWVGTLTTDLEPKAEL